MPQHSPFSDGRLLVVAFEGWNDAGEAASGLARRIVDSLELDELREIDGERYVDYQFNRPEVGFDDDGERGVQWPRIVLHGPSAEGRPVIGATGAPTERDVFVLVGPEPSRTWRGFCAEVIDLADVYSIDAVVFVGAMLADVPHTRPISVFVSSENAGVRAAFDVDKSTYEGPTGILGVLADSMDKAGLTTLSLWASVPHYVHNAPSPQGHAVTPRQDGGAHRRHRAPRHAARRRRAVGGGHRRPRLGRRGHGVVHRAARAGA
ncbi:proteasome assembly chaperone family protein [Curtobacterium sp. MCPF17_052]|uniref:proteasome assembly chaperone family protein n=1 Tax=Curtobacterium sp. MCPF17_052 TaxID=2175655 RepID=UPI00346430DF